MKAAVSPLSWSHPLQQREPAIGFASRLAALNGISLYDFLREMGLDPRLVVKGESRTLRNLAELAGADTEALIRYTPAEATEGFQAIAGETFTRSSVLRSRFRYCPHCVAEDMERFEGPLRARPWLRIEWMIHVIRICPIHGTLLCEATPKPAGSLGHDFCAAMADLQSRISTQKASAVSIGHSALTDWVIARLDGRLEPTEQLARHPLYVVTELSTALGLSSLHPSKMKANTLSAQQWAEASEEGFRILRGGKSELTELLRRMNDVWLDSRGAVGLRQAYGHIYGLLQETNDDPNFEEFRETVRGFASSTLPLKQGTEILGRTLDKTHVYSVYSASKASGAHAFSIRKLFARKGLIEEEKTSMLPDHRVLVRADDVEPILFELKGSLSASEVRTRIGIPRVHLNAMVACGYLPAVTGSIEKTKVKYRFATSAVEEMLARLLDGAVPVESPASRQMSICDVRLVARTKIDPVLALIFDGRLSWKGLRHDKHIYSSVLLDADEVAALLRKGPNKAGFTPRELADFVPGLSPKAANLLLDAGYFKISDQHFPNAQRTAVATEESVHAFRADYVTLGELKQTSGLHPNSILKMLDRADIVPVEDYDRVSVFFYKRDGLEEILSALEK